MSNSGNKQRPSLIKRLFYLLVVVSGGSAGLGGWALKDHPQVQALWTLLAGNDDDKSSPSASGSLVNVALDAIKPQPDLRRPGVYQVTIRKVALDPALFKAGHTVDIQVSVHKREAHGRDTTLWDSKAYGERLAVVGRDELSAGWPNRPFQVEWQPGEPLILEVSDRKTGLFAEPKRFVLADSDPAPNEFPLKSGDFPLEPVQKPGQTLDPRNSHVVLRSERAGDIGRRAAAAEIAERPIVIK
jgi:hypothetical protein